MARKDKWTDGAARQRHTTEVIDTTETIDEVRFAAQRSRRFAELESLITSRESTRRSGTREIAEDDLALRDRELAGAARRRARFEVVARLAVIRRATLDRAAPGRRGSWTPGARSGVR